MNLKALLVCDDVRLELGGTMSLIGVYNDRLIAPPGEGSIFLPRLSFVAVVAGLKGIHQIGYRQRIQQVDAPVPAQLPPLQPQAHDSATNEHNFIFSMSPMEFPAPGAYEVVLDLDTGARQATFRYRFYLERATT